MKKQTVSALCGMICALCGFILQTRGGIICWRAEEENLWHQTTQTENMLPNARDRAALEAGIYLEDRAALTCALEDYCS